MADNFYQISVMLSGKLLDFNIEDHNYNKYRTGTGTLLVNDGQNNQIFPITAGKELAEQLIELKGSYIELTGAVRNYRCNDEKYNVIRVYSVEAKTEDTKVNSVQAICEVIGLMAKQSTYANTNVKAAQVYLLTNEKYDKHTRLNAVIFGTQGMPLSLDKLPTLGTLYHFVGYLQLDRANQEAVKLGVDDSASAVEGKLELVITSYKEVNNDSRKGNDN